MYGQVNPFDPRTLALKDIINNILNQHYTDRERPSVLDTLRPKRDDQFVVKHIGGSAGAGGQQTHKAFDVAQSASAPFVSNFTEVTLPANKFRIFFGLQVEVADGASDAVTDISTLDFGAPVDNQVLNGRLAFRANANDILKAQPVRSLVSNFDEIPNLVRFPFPLVWEPNQNLELQLELAAAFGTGVYKYVRFTLIGWELSKG